MMINVGEIWNCKLHRSAQNTDDVADIEPIYTSVQDFVVTQLFIHKGSEVCLPSIFFFSSAVSYGPLS